MLKVKWRTNPRVLFEQYTEVPMSFVRRYIGPISPSNSEQISFRIVDPIPAILQPYLKRDHEIILLNMSEWFYLIEGNLLLIYSHKAPVAMLRRENITDFRIGNNEWEPIDNAVFMNQFCIVSQDPNSFVVIGGSNSLTEIIDDEESVLGELSLASLGEFQATFAIFAMAFL